MLCLGVWIYIWSAQRHSFTTLLELKREEGRKFQKTSSLGIVCLGGCLCRSEPRIWRTLWCIFLEYSSLFHYLKTFCKHCNMCAKKSNFHIKSMHIYCLTRSAVLSPAEILLEQITLFEDAPRKVRYICFSSYIDLPVFLTSSRVQHVWTLAWEMASPANIQPI